MVVLFALGWGAVGKVWNTPNCCPVRLFLSTGVHNLVLLLPYGTGVSFFLTYLSCVSWGSFNLFNSYSYFFREGVLKMSLIIRGAKPVLQRRQTFPELPGC